MMRLAILITLPFLAAPMYAPAKRVWVDEEVKPVLSKYELMGSVCDGKGMFPEILEQCK